ncbi:MAG: glycosyltransferase [Candidatus Absconditabacterales bacterium]
MKISSGSWIDVYLNVGEIDMQKKHVYFLINSLEGGGAERVVTNFANIAIKEGKEVYIITLKSISFYDLPKGVHHIPLSNIKNNFLMFLLIPRYVWKFRNILRKYHLFEGMSLLEIANFVHILAKKRSTISFRTHISVFKGVFGLLQRVMIKILYPRAGTIVVNSLENKYDLAEYLHVPEEKIIVIYNPIDKERIEKMKSEEISEELKNKIQGKRVLITTGRLVGKKGFGNKNHNKIILALKTVYDTVDKNRIYLIIGDGPERPSLEKLVHSLGLQDNIVFLGMQKNIFKYLNVADVFLYASEVEGFPNVLIEAKEVGLPIITSDFKSGAKEVILGEYTKDIGKNVHYPYQGKYGTLLDLNDYQDQFLETYKKMFISC